MMYPYITLADETEIVHSELREKNGEKYIEVHFERPRQTGGFDSARCVLPSYTWLYNELLSHNAHTLFKYAASGGMKIAWYSPHRQLLCLFPG
jgi:hypothetical protein